MSAIWGVIDCKQTISEDVIHKMKKSMENFSIDRYDSMVQSNVYLACGHQHFTEIAEKDVSPYYEESMSTFFVADCYLYNRDELIQQLMSVLGNEKEAELKNDGDAMLLYEGYKCWGESFAVRIRGSFSVVIYDVCHETVLLYTDHLARRYLAYCYTEGSICFSTLYQPILAYLGKERIVLSEEWIMNAHTNCTADELKLPGKTVYENVFQVEPGHYVKVDLKSGQAENIAYWEPLNDSLPIYKKNDEEYKELFLATLEGAVTSMLRAKGRTGILLSGGLDSSSVAAFAAKKLGEQGKELYSYTAVPVDGYVYRNDGLQTENEKHLVLAQQQMYPNIVTHFINMQEMNCFTNLENYIKQFRKPIKPVVNMVNEEGMARAAAGDGCSILLSGQNGNATISYGSITTYIYQKCLSGHFFAAYREAKSFCKRHRVPKKRLLKFFFNALKEENVYNIKFDKDCLLRDEDIKKHRLLHLERRTYMARGNGLVDSVKRRKGFCFMPLTFQHMGLYETYSSLEYGVLSLDPTLTVEIIELCMNLPIDCFVHDGKERRAVRDYMKGYVPDVILENYSARGVQAADFAYRVNRDWDLIKEDVYRLLQEPVLVEYLDADKVNGLIQEAKEKEYQMDKNLVARLAVIASLACFLRITCEEL